MSSDPPPYQNYESLDHAAQGPVTVDPNVRRHELPDDFKYSTTIISCEFPVRQRFMARVYSILSAQLLLTLAFCYAATTSGRLQLFLLRHTALYVVAVIAALVSCVWLALAPRAEDYETEPADPLLGRRAAAVPWYCLGRRGQWTLLAVFTVAESYCLGGSVMFESRQIVLNALLVTAVVVVGVSLMAFSGRFQIALESAASIYYWLNLALLLLIGIGLSALLFGGMGSWLNYVYGWVGAVVFSVYLFVDTQLIFRKMYVGEEIRCAMMLYLDIINLFLSILRILSSQNNDD
ncbi:hypothetical protein HG536_0E02350 [Torulaspora globosa]|uniref:Bax inhibitor 1 n=1 Tax=Torulaspora globosa TaxID=48254 RepID=A0A7G3ZII8_9SACH|nr:uncharacterized protein HG536_0E02350 [Torulaspora globosa]QLL33324.1 hypothetical protein HG536_0E02350 [Torulaspora globosa]